MRCSTIVACATLFWGSTTFSAPTTQPSEAATAVPTTQPAPVETGSILVLPFVESTSEHYPWLAKAIQQDLLADLGRATRIKVEAPASAAPAHDAKAAIDAGRTANATLVVYGQYQIVGNQARFSGQVLDVKTQQPGGSFFSTGLMTNLFQMEDSLVSQLLRDMPPGWVTVSLPPATQSPLAGVAPYVAPPAAAPPAAQTPNYYSYTYPDYSVPSPGYSYYYGADPYYSYSVPYYGPDLWFFGDFDVFHHHFRDHHFDGHGFSHGGTHGFGHAPAAHSGGGGGSHGGGGHGR